MGKGLMRQSTTNGAQDDLLLTIKNEKRAARTPTLSMSLHSRLAC